LQSLRQGGRGVWGRGLQDISEGAWARQRLTASWLWSAECVWGALEILTERIAQPSLRWRGGYKASEMRVPAFGLLKGAALQPSLGLAVTYFDCRPFLVNLQSSLGISSQNPSQTKAGMLGAVQC